MAEHDPLEIWERTRQVIGATLAKAQVVASDIAAITNQRETTLLWDRRSGRPVYNAIVWQDTRTDRICCQPRRRRLRRFHRPQDGPALATYFAYPKIRWMLDNVPGVRQQAEAGDLLFGTVDTWLIWNLTGGKHVTDPTNASRTMLMDLETLDWDDEMLDVLGILLVIPPEIRPSSDPDFYGRTLNSGAARRGPRLRQPG